MRTLELTDDELDTLYRILNTELSTLPKDDTFRIKVKDLFKKVLITIANSVETK